MIVGMFWYSPFLFGKTWMDAAKIHGDSKSPSTNLIYGISAVLAFIKAYALMYVFNMVGVDSLTEAVKLSLILSVGLIFTSSAVNHLYEGRSPRLTAIDVGFHIVTMVLMGVITYILS